MALTLYIGNKNYSSWSMRPWVLMRQHGIAFDEVKLRFDSFAPDSVFKQRMGALGAAGKVPVLTDGERVVWDTLAIAEYLAELHPEKPLWPRDAGARALARSVVAEMHSGFTALRTHCPQNLEARLPEVGARILREHPAVAADLARVVQLWQDLLARHGGPLLFGADFGIADAFYAPVTRRIVTYGLPVPEPVQRYIAAVEAQPGVAAWIADALAEHDFLLAGEPYRTQR